MAIGFAAVLFLLPVSGLVPLLVWGAAPTFYRHWLLFAGFMEGLCITIGYLSKAVYGGALLMSGWAGETCRRTPVVVGLVAAAGFLEVRGFDLPLLVQRTPYPIGLILLRRPSRAELLACTAVA